ncbi:MAG: sigma-70 family RNA polymerase sigma factor, partial [Mucinivorans sp.]
MKNEIRSDSELLMSYIQGDKQTINPLLKRHKARVYNYVLMMVKDPSLADDITQETFIKIMSSLDKGKYADNGKFISWALRIAHNQVIDHFRSGKGVQMITNDDVGYDILSRSELSTDNAEDVLVREQTAQQIRSLVDMLPQEQR